MQEEQEVERVPLEPGYSAGEYPSRMSVSQRLPQRFKFVFTSATVHDHLLQLSGAIQTQDQLDAICEALSVMRQWLAPSASAIEARSDATPESGAAAGESAVAKPDAQPLTPKDQKHDR